MSDATSAPPQQVPLHLLSPEALQGIIESYVLRAGMDDVAADIPLETKIQQVRRQLDQGSVKIVFDPLTESVTLLTENEWRLRQRQHSAGLASI